jgi:hypothetical protein
MENYEVLGLIGKGKQIILHKEISAALVESNAKQTTKY